MPIGVLIVDDHPVVRRGLRALLEVQDGIEVAGEAGDGPTALALAAEHHPDVILLDLKLPAMSGLAVLTELKTRDAASKVLVLTSVTDPDSAGQVMPSHPCSPTLAMNWRRRGVSTICAIFSRVTSKTSGSSFLSRNSSTSLTNSSCSGVNSKSMVLPPSWVAAGAAGGFLTDRQIRWTS